MFAAILEWEEESGGAVWFCRALFITRIKSTSVRLALCDVAQSARNKKGKRTCDTLDKASPLANEYPSPT